MSARQPLPLQQLNAQCTTTNLLTEMNKIRNDQESNHAFITKYRLQLSMLQSIQKDYTYYLTTAKTINHDFFDQQVAILPPLHQNLEEWAIGEETRLTQLLDSTYPPVPDSIKTNLGRVEFRQNIDDANDKLYAVKFSEIKSGQKFEDPVHEAWFSNFTGKDTHQRMLPLVTACTLRNQFILITPKALGTDLFRYITLNPQVARQNAFKIFSELCYALDYLHNHLGVAHLDLKPENVFLDAEHLPILGDFGMARAGEFPLHAHNIPQGYKFYFARQITSSIREHMENLCVDEASLTILPRFALSYKEFEAWLPFLRNRQNDPIDLVPYINSFTIAGLRQMPVTQPAQTTTMGDDNNANATQPPIQLPDELSFSFVDYCRQVAVAQYSELSPEEQAGIDFDTYLLQVAAHVSQEDFYQYTIQTLRATYPDEIVTNHLQVHFNSGLPSSLYSQLSPDLSTLAMRPTTTTLGTRAYMAPEVFSASPSYDPFKADIYSLGVVFFILVLGFPPYRNAMNNPRHPDHDPAYERLCMHFSQPLQPGQSRLQGVTKLINDYGKSDAVDKTVCDLLDRMMDFNVRTRCSIKRIINEFLPRLRL